MAIFDGIFGKKEKAKSEADAIKLELRALLQDLPVIQKENISDYGQRIMDYTTPPHPCMFSGSIDEAIDFVAKMVRETESYILSCEGIIRVKRTFLISSLPVNNVLEIQYEQFWDDGTSAIYSENVMHIGDDQFEVFGSEKSATRMTAIWGDRVNLRCVEAHEKQASKQTRVSFTDATDKPNLEKMKTEKDVEGLINELKHEDAKVRWGAIVALHRIGDKRAIDPLIQVLKDEKDYVRSEAIMVLREIPDARSVEPLIQLLKDKKDNVRLSAITALGWIGDKRAVEPLISTLKSEKGKIREIAARALGEIGDARALESLNQALTNEDWSGEGRLEAESALKHIKSKAKTISSVQLKFDCLTAELIHIGKTNEFLTVKPKIGFDESKRNIRAREIGMRLNEMGGKKLMQQVYLKVKTDLGAVPARELEFAWNYIGEWLA